MAETEKVWIEHPEFGIDYALINGEEDIYYEPVSDEGDSKRRSSLEDSLDWLEGIEWNSEVYLVTRKLVALVRPHVQA